MLHSEHHMQTNRMCERGLRKSIFHRFSPSTSNLQKVPKCVSVVRKQSQQQNNSSGTRSFCCSNLNIASESDGFNETKRSGASPDPSSIIINNKKQQHSTTIIFTSGADPPLNSNPPSLDYTPPWGKSLSIDMEVPTPRDPPYPVRTPHFVEL